MLELLVLSPSALVLFSIYMSIGLMFVGFLYMLGQLDFLKMEIEEKCKNELGVSDPKIIKSIQNTIIITVGLFWLPHVLTILMTEE